MRKLSIMLVAAALGANAAFLGLGALFDYPDVLRRPAAEVLAAYHARAVPVAALFLLLAASATMLAPISVALARLVRPGDGRRAVVVVFGIGAATVQVVGLLRWPLIVPFLDAGTFPTVHTLLGTALGETLGYLLTAGWTVAVTRLLFAGPPAGGAGTRSRRVLAGVGLGSAVLIAAGVLVPLGVPGTDLANFVGYVVWSGWLVALAVVSWRRTATSPRPGAAGTGPATGVPSPTGGSPRPGWLAVPAPGRG